MGKLQEPPLKYGDCNNCIHEFSIVKIKPNNN